MGVLKRPGREADPDSGMESGMDLEKALTKAGWKLGGGLLLVGALVGVRIVTADPDGIKAEIAELETLERALERDAEERGVESPRTEADDGLMARMSATVRDRMPGRAEPGPDPNRLVRCQLGGGIQFTRAADCQSRGGDAIDVD